MSDRIADRADEVLESIEDMLKTTSNEEVKNMLYDAGETIQEVAEFDRMENGPTPTDKLRTLVETRQTCLNCGDRIEKGAWCGLECLREWGAAIENE